jgi:hypothetical protein
MRPPSTRTVGLVVALTAVLTLFHFTDNAVNLETYPGPSWQPGWFEWVVVASWPFYLALGVIGYVRYRAGHFPSANAFLVAYSFIGLVSIGHFFYASPDELTTRGLISVLVDIAAGTVVLAVAFWSILARRPGVRAPVH